VDSRKTDIACADSITSFGLQVIQESNDFLDVDVIKVKTID
jgi:hypothetical protein